MRLASMLLASMLLASMRRATSAPECEAIEPGVTADVAARMGHGRALVLERMVRDARMFTIGGGTVQILRTVVASGILGRKLPQTCDGHLKLARERVVKTKAHA